MPTDETTGFRATVDQLEAARTDRTKALVFVSPSNPTGAVYPPEEVDAIGRWALEHGIWVITDEIYEHLTFGEHRFTSIATAVPELADTCVILNGVAKTYAMTGWRVGWLIGPPDVVKAATNLQSHSTSNVVQRRPGGGARRASADRSTPSSRCGTAFDRRAGIAHRDPQRHRRRHLPRARGRLLRLPEPHRPARPDRSGAARRRPPPSWPSCCSTR